MPGWLPPATDSTASARATHRLPSVRAWGRVWYCPSICWARHMSGSSTTDYEHLLRDNYETPLYTPQLVGGDFELQQLEMILKLSVDDFKAHARTISSPGRVIDVYRSPPHAAGIAQPALDHHARYRYRTRRRLLALRGCHSPHRPPVRGVVESGAKSEPEYAGNTTLFILPDFGRDGDQDTGGNGFQHHRTGDAASRTTWMLAMGTGVRQGVVYDRPYAVHRSGAHPGRDDGLLALAVPGQDNPRAGLALCFPTNLKAEQFASYPPQARVAHCRRTWPRCNRCRSPLCPACCAKPSITITSFPPSGQPLMQNSPS